MSTLSAALCVPAAVESATHSFLFGRLQLYMQHHDYESACFIAERMLVALREHIRLATEDAMNEQAQRAQRGDADASVLSVQAEDTLLALSHSLEAVQHLLALSEYHMHNARRRGGMAGGSWGAGGGGGGGGGGSAAKSFGTAASQGGGASYAYQLLKNNHHFTEENQFFFAHCCFELGRFAEGEEALLSYSTPNPDPMPRGVMESEVEASMPDVRPPKGAQGLLLLGKICHRSSRPAEAAIYYRRALHADPFLWSAFQALCGLGVLTESILGSDTFFRIDMDEFAPTCPPPPQSQQQQLQSQQANQAAQQQQQQQQPRRSHRASSLSPPRAPRAQSQSHLLLTPSSAIVPHLHMLSLTTPTPRQALLFATPSVTNTTTKGNVPASAAAAASSNVASTPALQSFTTPPPAGASASASAASVASAAANNTLLTPTRSSARVGAKHPPASSSFASPPSSKPRPPRAHVRAQTTFTGGMASAAAAAMASAASAAAPSSSPSASARKVVSRLNWGDSAASAGAAAGATSSRSAAGGDYSSDDANSERERNEKKMGRRINRAVTPGEKQPKTPRLDRNSTDAPTTPRRNVREAASSSSSSSSATNAALLTARKVTPANRRATASAAAAAGGSSAAFAPSKRRLPEIAESATPESANQSSSSLGFGATPMGGGGTNLLQSLQTPSSSSSLFTTPAASGIGAGVAPAPARHARSRSHASGLPSAAAVAASAGLGGPLDRLQGLPADNEDEDEDDPMGGGGGGDDDDDAAAGGFTGTGTEGGGGSENDDDAAATSAAALTAELLALQEAEAHHALVGGAAKFLTGLFQTFGEAYRLQQGLLDSRASVSTWSTLPSHHFHSNFVQVSLGRCYFERHDWVRSISCFEVARGCLPGSESLKGVDYLSTALWHRGDSKALSGLAHSCVNQDPSSPLAWIVLGNCFSLAKEHETALKYFRRAIQMDPSSSAMPYTLSAHEYVSNEEFDRAITGYRLALSIDSRAYSAWYGLGSLYLRQEKFKLALYHFEQALAVHSESSILCCYVGLSLHSLGRFDSALEYFSRAEVLDPTNPLPLYHRAQTLLAMAQLAPALAILAKLQAIVPREANVHMLMGRIKKKMGDLDGAMLCFVTALDLDPKDRTAIKAAIDNLHSGSAGIDEEDAEAEM